jgi:lipopolysaccharide transport system ATP-binding protein
MSRTLAISADGLGKRYRLGASLSRHDSLRDLIRTRVESMLKRSGGEEKRRAEFWALRDVRFDVEKGENVGIIGLNGAGKSTLLKILSRIVTPTEGRARITGRLGALLEVGTGFHQELTGRENIYLYGSILGMTRHEVNRKFDAIVDFSEIADFVDTPVKRYSSGMYVRLAFSVAAHLEPDILLLDEVLAVGDFSFQRKCMDFAHALERRGATILFVSHNMFSIKSMCQRVIYLKKGEMVFDGPTDEALRLYETDSKLARPHWFRKEADAPVIKVTDIKITDEFGNSRTVFSPGERMRVRVSFKAPQPIEQPNFLFSFERSDQVLCCNFSSTLDNFELSTIEGKGSVELLTPPIKLTADNYTVMVTIRERRFHRIIEATIGDSFHVKDSVLAPIAFGVFHERGEWRFAPARSAQ